LTPDQLLLRQARWLLLDLACLLLVLLHCLLHCLLL
jgi:hypothetical protein